MVQKVTTQPATGGQSASKDLASRSAGLCLAASLTLLILVPILQTPLVGVLSRVVPAAVLVLAAYTVARRGLNLVWQPTILLIGYAILCAGATIVAPDVGGLNQLIVHILVGGSAYLMASCCNCAERMLVVRTVVVMAVLESVHGVAELAGLIGPRWGYMRLDASGLPNPYKSEIFEGAVRAQGTLGHPLLLAFLSCVAIGLIIGLRPFSSEVLRFILVCVLFTGIIATSSRSGVVVATLLIVFSARKVWVRFVVGLWSAGLILAFLTLVDFWSSEIVDRFLASASLSNRASSVGTFVPLLTNQGPVQILFGNGLWSAPRLYKTGVLPYNGGFFAIDNQIVSTLACCGLLALVLMVTALTWSLCRADPRFRWGIAAAVMMFSTFEVLIWPTSLALTFALVGMAVNGTDAGQAGIGRRAGLSGAGSGCRIMPEVTSPNFTMESKV